MIKKEYLQPEVDVLEVNSEGVICQSGLNVREDYTLDDTNPFI